MSLVPLAGSAHGVTTKGLRWALDDATLEGSRARGVSNVSVADIVSVSVDSGCVSVVLPAPSNDSTILEK